MFQQYNILPLKLLKTANELGDSDYILECNTMLTDISSLYLKYTADVNIINLINIYDNKLIIKIER